MLPWHWIMRKFPGFFGEEEKPVVPTAEYNFGPFKRVLVENAVPPPIGAIIWLGTIRIGHCGVNMFVDRLEEYRLLEFPEESHRWQVTDVEFVLTPDKRSYHGGIVSMKMAPHFRVYLAPVSPETSLVDTLPKKEKV